MSLDSSRERSMWNLNPEKWQPACCINPCIQLHNSLLRSAALGRDFENYLWYVIKIVENELDKEWSRSRAINIWNQLMEFHAVNCWPKALKRFRPTLFNLLMTCIVVAQKLRGLEAFGCKLLYIEMLFWQSIMTVWILRTIGEHPITVSMSVRWASTERQQFRVWSIQ